MALPFDVIGGTDCELVAAAPVAQPVAMATSLAYLVAGVAVAHRAGVRQIRALVYGIVLALVGLGSIVYHGPQPGWARWAHDLPIAVLFLVIATHDLDLLGRLGRRGWAAVTAIAVGVVGLVFAAVPEAAGPVTGVLVMGAIIAEVAVRRTRRSQGEDIVTRRRAPAVMAAVVPLALVAYLFGRTGSPLCDPDGLYQLHGLWHVLSAVALGLWPAATGLLDDAPPADVTGTVPGR